MRPIIPKLAHILLLIHKHQSPFALLLIIHKLPLIILPLVISKLPKAISLAIFPLSIIHCAIAKMEDAISMYVSIEPVAFIPGPIWPAVFPFPILRPIHEVSFISRVVFPGLHAFSILQPIFPLALVLQITCYILAHSVHLVVVELALVELAIGEFESALALADVVDGFSCVDGAVVVMDDGEAVFGLDVFY